MTKRHLSPKTGKLSRCRAEIACAYGDTFGTVIRRDGTVDVGTGSPSWSNLPQLPDEHGSQERIIVDENGEAKNIWHVENQPGRMAAKKRTEKELTNTVEKVEPTKSESVVEEYTLSDGSTFTMTDGRIYGSEDDRYSGDPELPYELLDEMRATRFRDERIGPLHNSEVVDILEETVQVDADILFPLMTEEEAQKESEILAEIANEKVNDRKFRNPTPEEWDQRRADARELRELKKRYNTLTDDEKTRYGKLEKKTRDNIIWVGRYDRIVPDNIMAYWHMQQGTELGEKLTEESKNLTGMSTEAPFGKLIDLIEQDRRKRAKN